MKKVCFLGCGNMVRALVSGFMAQHQNHNLKFYFYTPSKSKAIKMSSDFDGVFVSSLSEIPQADIYVLGFKPQNYKTALNDYAKVLNKNSQIWSLLAGISLERLSIDFHNQEVIRIMPNTCSQVKSGISLYCSKTDIDVSDFENFFGASSKVFQMKNDKQLDLVTGVTGSGSALIFEYLLGFQDFLIKSDITSVDSCEMISQLLLGTAKMLSEVGDMKQLQSNIVSKEGVTDAALKSLRNSQLEHSVELALREAFNRSVELSK